MNRLPSIRRWGVAALTGVTLFGGLSIVGAGAASAATTPTVSAAVTATATTIPGTGSGTGANITLTVNGTTLPGDKIILTLACPTSGSASFTGVTSSDTNLNTSASIAGEGTSCSSASTATFTVGTGETNPVLNLSAIGFTTSGVTSQALTITGSYQTLGQAATSFTVPTDASVSWYSVTSNTPAVNLPTSGTTSVSNIQINDPTTVTGVNQPVSVGTTSVVDTQGVAGTVDPTISQGGATIPNAQVGVVYPTQTFTVTPGTGSTTITSLVASTLPGGLSFTAATNKLTGTITGTPTVSGAFTFTVTATDGATTAGTAVATVTGFVVAPNKITLTIGGAGSVGDTWGATAPTMSVVGANAVLSSSSTVLTLTFTAGTMQNALLTLSGLSVVTTSGTSVPGAQMVDVALVGGATSTALATVSVGTILGTATTIYGANGTADGTVAAEFENAYPANSGNTASGNRNVVLATDVAGTNGSDALAASYLEGTLGTGLLITPATTLGADAKLAMQLEGVTTVYVVGGPLAISPAVIAQIKALPAYNAGGLTQTGSNINVVGPIYGADGTAAGTAAAIATYYGTAIGAATFPSAYSNTGIGSYNTTTGVGTTTAPSGIVPTAIVVASSDWQDALSIAPEAFAKRFPIILTGPSSSTTLSATASATLTSLGVKQVIIAGGQLALQNSVEAQIAALNGGISVLRIAGIDNTDTAAQIANFAWGTGGVSGLGWTAASGHDSVMVSHGDYWTDALGAAALGGGANQATYGYEPILLTQTPTVIGQYTTAELAKVPSGVVNLTVLGGPLAMPASTVQTLLLGL